MSAVEVPVHFLNFFLPSVDIIFLSVFIPIFFFIQPVGGIYTMYRRFRSLSRGIPGSGEAAALSTVMPQGSSAA